MFKRKYARALMKSIFSTRPVSPSPVAIEGLEDRRLLSGGHGHHGAAAAAADFSAFDSGHGGATIQFSQAPSAVQSGLDTLASTDGVAAPISSQSVRLGNSNGVETYTVDILSSGTDTRLTVDQNGNPVTAPTRTTTTLGAISNTAVTTELTAIATALGLTAPTSTTSVTLVTASDGTSTYTVNLGGSSTSSTGRHGRHGGGGGGTTISVDANGNPVGNERVPLSTLSTAIQNGLTANAPAGATALTAGSLIDVRRQNGVTTYSATYTSTGTRTTVTVNSAGALASLPSSTQVQFSTIPAAAQSELQALATADGAAAIAATQTVNAYDEANGTTIYSVRVTATDAAISQTYTLTISVDQNGNPTVPPRDGFFGGGDGGGGAGCDGGSDTTTTTGSTSGNSSSSSSSSSTATSARRRRR